MDRLQHHEAGIVDSVLLKLQNYQSDKDLRSLCIGIASCDDKVGVTTIAIRLATQFAESGFGNVLLVDGNSERPMIHQAFRSRQSPGMVDHLCDGIDLSECIQQTDIPQLQILPWGSNGYSASSISPLNLKPLFDELRSRYQWVILDLPTMDGSGYGLFFANHTDGVILVVDAVQSRAHNSKKLLRLLEEDSIEVIGAILNRYTPTLPKWLRRWF